MPCQSRIPIPNPWVYSPDHLRAQLDDPRICRRRDFAEAAGADRASWRIPVRLVQYVEELGAKLKPHRPGSETFLNTARSNTLLSGPITVERPALPKRSDVGTKHSWRRSAESSAHRAADLDAHHVGADSAVCADAERIARSKHRDREARLPLVNPVHLPIADDLIDHAGCRCRTAGRGRRASRTRTRTRNGTCDGWAPAPSRLPDRRCSGCGCPCRCSHR